MLEVWRKVELESTNTKHNKTHPRLNIDITLEINFIEDMFVAFKV